MARKNIKSENINKVNSENNEEENNISTSIDEVKNEIDGNNDNFSLEESSRINESPEGEKDSKIGNILSLFTISSELVEDSKELKDFIKKPVRYGLICFIALFVFVGGWAAFAPLDSAAIAVGTVVLGENKKLVQHLEGGIIKELYVSDGDTVKEGDMLVRLDETKAKANWEIFTGQLMSATVLEDRLISERDGFKKIEFRKSVLSEKSNNSEMKKHVDAQERLFNARNEALTGQIGVFNQRIKQLGDEIDGLESQKVAAETQLSLIKEEIVAVKKLVEEGLAQKPRLLALKREQAQLTGRIGEFTALIARAGQSITENELSIINLKNEKRGEVVSELRKIQAEIADLRERVGATKDILNRIEIIAPRSGIITDLKFHTIGGVISPGQEVLSIVPQDDELIIEAQVKPTDIDLVRKGLDARVRLSAYKARTVPIMEGKIISVSPDRFIDKYTGIGYYSSKVRITKESMAELGKDIELYPGMPAEVLIVTGTKTPLGYLIDPITAYIDKAFREE